MSAETVATVYVIGAVVWFPAVWVAIFWEAHVRTPDWQHMEDATALAERRWPRFGSLVSFGVLFALSLFVALTWPYRLVQVVRVVFRTLQEKLRDRELEDEWARYSAECERWESERDELLARAEAEGRPPPIPPVPPPARSNGG